MNLFLYKLLMYPLKFTNFFKYGIPYCYLVRSIDEKTEKIKFNLCWYFNNNGLKKNNILKKNYSNFKFLGYKKSLYFSYKHLFNIKIKNKKWLKIQQLVKSLYLIENYFHKQIKKLL